MCPKNGGNGQSHRRYLALKVLYGVTRSHPDSVVERVAEAGRVCCRAPVLSAELTKAQGLPSRSAPPLALVLRVFQGG